MEESARPTPGNIDFKRASFSLEGKVALVIGASRGLGEAIALGYANAGADLVLASRTEDQLNRVAGLVREMGRKAVIAVTDVTELSQCQAMVDKALAELGRIDILVNNAGRPLVSSPVIELKEEDWLDIIKVNLTSVFYCCQVVGRLMVAQQSGKVINMSSQFGVVGYPTRAAYASAKGGIIMLTKVLALEWAPNGITVNALAPTHLETPSNSERVQKTDFKEEMLPRMPLGHLGRWEDIIGAAIYLAAPASDLVTGHTLMIDAGWTVI